MSPYAQMAWWGLFIGAISFLPLLAAGPGHRFGLWGYKAGLSMMEWAAYGGASGLILASVAFLSSLKGSRQTLIIAAIGLAFGLIDFGVPWYLYQNAKRLPPINDITTDAGDPPAFAALAEARLSAGARLDYPGADTAGAQRQAYPEIAPVVLGKERARAFDAALKAAERMGWDVVASDAGAGRIEAVDTTFWFGFKDDIVVRLSPAQGAAETRIDARSASRVGIGDAGKNAERLSEYIRRLKAQ